MGQCLPCRVMPCVRDPIVPCRRRAEPFRNLGVSIVSYSMFDGFELPYSPFRASKRRS